MSRNQANLQSKSQGHRPSVLLCIPVRPNSLWKWKWLDLATIHSTNRGQIEQQRNVLARNKSNEKRRWLGIPRDCGFADTGSMSPCAAPECILCSIVRMSVRQDLIPNGIICTSLPEKYCYYIYPFWATADDLACHFYFVRAVARSLNKTKTPKSRVLLLADVLLGNEAEILVTDDIVLPRNAHSVRLFLASALKKTDCRLIDQTHAISNGLGIACDLSWRFYSIQRERNKSAVSHPTPVIMYILVALAIWTFTTFFDSAILLTFRSMIWMIVIN